jgi:hypothetical protein
LGSYLHGYGEHSRGLVVISSEDAGDGLVFTLWDHELVDIQVKKPLSTVTVPARHISNLIALVSRDLLQKSAIRRPSYTYRLSALFSAPY